METHTITIAGTDTAVPAQAGETLLRAALRGGLRMPHLCMAGECGSCRCRLNKGKIRLRKDIGDHVEHGALKQGFLLACQAEALTDVELDVPGLSPGGQAGAAFGIPGRILATRQLSPDILRVVVALDRPLHYVAGQYAQLCVPGHAQLADAARCYSFSDAPGVQAQTELSFHIRQVPGGAFTGWLFGANRAGADVLVSGPFGDMHVRHSGRPMVCIAGGSGLAPIKAMLESMLAQRSTRDVTLFFAARSQQDLYCMDELEAMQAAWPSPGHMHIVPVLSAEPADSGWTGARGYCTDLIDKYCQPAGTDFYLCGPPAMIDSVRDALRGQAAGGELFYDRFIDRSNLEEPA